MGRPPTKVVRRPGEVRMRPLDAGSTEPVVKNFQEASHIFRSRLVCVSVEMVMKSMYNTLTPNCGYPFSTIFNYMTISINGINS